MNSTIWESKLFQTRMLSASSTEYQGWRRIVIVNFVAVVTFYNPQLIIRMKWISDTTQNKQTFLACLFCDQKSYNTHVYDPYIPIIYVCIIPIYTTSRIIPMYTCCNTKTWKDLVRHKVQTTPVLPDSTLLRRLVDRGITCAICKQSGI